MVSDYPAEGQYWRVNLPLVASMDLDLVIPEAFLAQPENIGAMSYSNRYGIVIKGFSYHFESSGASSLSLISHDDPWIAEGTVTDDTLWQQTVNAAGYYSHTVDRCHWPLAPGGRRPDHSPTSADGARLKLTTATNIVQGFLAVWGTHTQNPWSRQSLTGSPSTFVK